MLTDVIWWTVQSTRRAFSRHPFISFLVAAATVLAISVAVVIAKLVAFLNTAPQPVSTVEWNPSGRAFAISYTGGAMDLITLESDSGQQTSTRNLIPHLPPDTGGPREPFRYAIWSKSDNLLWGWKNNSFAVWDMQACEKKFDYTFSQYQYGWIPDNGALVRLSSDPDTATLVSLDAKSGKEISRQLLKRPQSRSWDEVALSPDFHKVCMILNLDPEPQMMVIYDVTTNAEVSRWKMPANVTSCTWSPDSRFISLFSRNAPGRDHYVIDVFDIAKGALVSTISLPSQLPAPLTTAGAVLVNYKWSSDSKRIGVIAHNADSCLLTWWNAVEGTLTDHATVDIKGPRYQRALLGYPYMGTGILLSVWSPDLNYCVHMLQHVTRVSLIYKNLIGPPDSQYGMFSSYIITPAPDSVRKLSETH